MAYRCLHNLLGGHVDHLVAIEATRAPARASRAKLAEADSQASLLANTVDSTHHFGAPQIDTEVSRQK